MHRIKGKVIQSTSMVYRLYVPSAQNTFFYWKYDSHASFQIYGEILEELYGTYWTSKMVSPKMTIATLNG